MVAGLHKRSPTTAPRGLKSIVLAFHIQQKLLQRRNYSLRISVFERVHKVDALEHAYHERETKLVVSTYSDHIVAPPPFNRASRVSLSTKSRMKHIWFVFIRIGYIGTHNVTF